MLAGCGQAAKSEKNVDSFMQDVKKMDVDNSEQLSPLIKKDINDTRKDLLESLSETLEIEPDIRKSKGYDEFVDKLRSLQEEMSYEIKEVEVNKAKTIVKAKIAFNYVNVGDKFESILNNNLDKSVLKMSAGEIPESFIEDTLTALSDELDKINLEESLVEIESIVTIKKVQEEWRIAEVDDELYNVISLGISDYLKNSFDDKLEEVRVNKVFLEVESNFNTILDELNEKISNVKDIKGKKLSKSLTDKLGIEIHVGSNMEKEGVYYIFEKNEKVNISVMIDDEIYTIEKPMKKK